MLAEVLGGKRNFGAGVIPASFVDASLPDIFQTLEDTIFGKGGKVSIFLFTYYGKNAFFLHFPRLPSPHSLSILHLETPQATHS